MGVQGVSLRGDIWVTESRWCFWPHLTTGQSGVSQRARVGALPGVLCRDGGEDLLDESEADRRQHHNVLDPCYQGVTHAFVIERSVRNCVTNKAQSHPINPQCASVRLWQCHAGLLSLSLGS